MLKFSKLEPERLYRTTNKFSLPNKYDKIIGRENLITVFGESIDDTTKFLNNPHIRLYSYKRYYIDRRVRMKVINKQINIKNDQNAIYDNGYGLNNFDCKLAKTPNMCMNYNTIYELGQFNNIIFNDQNLNRKNILDRSKIQFSMIMDKLKEISTQFPNQKAKYLILPIDRYIPNTRISSMWTMRSYLDNHMIAFMRELIDPNNLDLIKSLSDWTLIFINFNELFYVKCKDFKVDEGVTIKKLIYKYKSSHGNINTEATNPEYESDTEEEEEIPEDTTEEDKVEDSNDKIIDSKLQKIDPIQDIKNYIPEDKQEEIKNKIISKGKEVSEQKSSTEIGSESNIEKAMTTEAKRELLNLVTVSPNVSPQRLARIKDIQTKMNDIKLDNQSLSEIKASVKSKIIENHKVKADVINTSLKNNKFDNFNKDYNKKLLNYDLTNILTCWSNMDRPLYLIKLDKEDTSTVMDKMYTYTAVYEDEHGKRHTLKFDYPKFINNKYIHLAHSDKQFLNQIVPLPVTKVKADEVQMTSNYKKIFLRRFGKNISSKLIKFSKLMPEIDSKIMTYAIGNNIKLNSGYMTSLEYDNLAERFSKITLKNENIELLFNQKEIRRIYDELGLHYTNDGCLFGIKTVNGKKESLEIDPQKDIVIGYDKSPVDFIIDAISASDPKFERLYNSTPSAKRMMYTRSKIAGKWVPILYVLAYLLGLEPLLNKLGVQYTFSEKKRLLQKDESIIQFNDGYLIYNPHTFANSLILNGLIDIPTKEYKFLQFSGKDIYHDIFNSLLGRRNFGSDLESFNQEFMDPITKEVCEDCNLPTNFIDLYIYANSLLENNACDNDGDLNCFRVRSNELVNAKLYNCLSKAYERYRATADSKSPVPFSIKRSELINALFDSQIFEESSTLSPLLEADRMRTTSYKGLGGCNSERAFSMQKRAFNKSMMGVLAQSSPFNAKVGITRVMSVNPNIKSLRGYIDPGSDQKLKDLDETNILSPVEMMLPLTPTHDDPDRVSMAATQSKHTISTVHSDTPLFGYGYDKVIASTKSDRFAFKAKAAGEVIELNDKLGYMILRYNDGKTDVVYLTTKQALNTGSGFYVTNKLTANVKVGDKVSEGDIVASNNDFFKYDNMTGDTIYKSGPLARVAMIHGSPVFEDSTIMTEKFADKMASYVTQRRDIRLGRNSNIYYLAKPGTKVNVTDSLIVFDESYNDEYLNKMLDKMSESEKQNILDSGKTSIKSKHNGEVIDVKIYYTVPKTELSESLRKEINIYEKDIKTRLKDFEKNNVNIKDMTSLNEEDAFIKPVNGKIKGIKMDDMEVLIVFYIRELDEFSCGDKCTFGTALKGIDQTLIPRGQEPFLASDPSIKIDAFCAVNGYYARMTNSFPIAMAINTVMIGAEKKIKDILDK